jgi:hypothetical protein
MLTSSCPIFGMAYSWCFRYKFSYTTFLVFSPLACWNIRYYTASHLSKPIVLTRGVRY